MIKHNRSSLELVGSIVVSARRCRFLADFTNRFVWYRFRCARAWARVHLGGPRQCLRVDVFPDARHSATSNGDGENPIVFERLVRGFDFPLSDTDDQNPVSLRDVFGGLC
jgi:hypothetical protein